MRQLLLRPLGYPLHRPHRRLLHGSIICSIVLLACLSAYLFVPRPKVLRADNHSLCERDITLLPRLQHEGSPDYSLRFEHTLSLGNFPIVSFTTCYQPEHPPREGVTSVLFPRFGPLPIPGKAVSLRFATLPTITQSPGRGELVDPRGTLTFSLSENDELFSYRLRTSGSADAVCSNEEHRMVRCPLAPLNLDPNTPYDALLVRTFRGTESPSLALRFSTTNFVYLTAAFTETIYDVPSSLVLQADRGLESVEEVSLVDTTANQILPIEASIQETSVLIRLKQVLPRRHTFLLSVKNATATDGGSVEHPYSISFTTSGGPRIVSTPFKRTGLETAPWLSVAFDQPLKLDQNLASNIEIVSNGSSIPLSAEIDGATLWVRPLISLPLCATFTLRTSGLLESEYGISGDSESSTNARVKCYESFAIGSSVEGRPLTGYRIGSGSVKVLFLGAVHGSEASSKELLYEWLDELDANIDMVPKEIQVIILPSVNPDGVASQDRLNKNGVDLNRNFPTANWQSATYASASTLLPYGGGTYPLSEPESSALAAYIEDLSPRLTLSYHSQGGYVIANDASDSRDWADRYAAATGYRYFDNSNYDDAFDYTVTGSFEDWMFENRQASTLLVELTSHYDTEFWRNKAAMWKMLEVR